MLGLGRSEIDAVVIPSRTLQHRRSRREKLTIEKSDRVLRVIRVLSLTSQYMEAASTLSIGFASLIPGLMGGGHFLF